MKDVVKRILAGETESFRLILREFGPSVRSMLAAHIYEPHTLDDLVQEVFLAAYENLVNFKPEMELGVWIRGIARNKMKMYLRQTYSHADALQQIRARMIERTAMIEEDEDAEQFKRLGKCLQMLSSRLHDIFQAHYFKHEKVIDIAARLNSSENAVSSLLFRGRKQLRNCMERAL